MKIHGAISGFLVSALALGSLRGQGEEKNAAPDVPKRLTLVVEFIEIGRADWNAWVKDPEHSIIGFDFRNHVQKLIEEDRATLVHTAITAGAEGEKIEGKSVGEYIYPTEWDPPRVAADGTTKTHQQGTSFETRNHGITVRAKIEESDAKLPDPFKPSEKTAYYGVDLVTELVEKIRDVSLGKENSEAVAPVFHTQGYNSLIRSPEGETILFSTHRPHTPAIEGRKNPVILTFVRLDVHDLSKEKETGR